MNQGLIYLAQNISTQDESALFDTLLRLDDAVLNVLAVIESGREFEVVSFCWMVGMIESSKDRSLSPLSPLFLRTLTASDGFMMVD